MFRIRKSLKTKNVKKCKLETNDKKKKRQHIKKKSLTRDEYKNETGKESKKKRKENMNKVPRLLILLGYRTLNIFCTKLKVKKCLRECASTYELGAVRK